MRRYELSLDGASKEHRLLMSAPVLLDTELALGGALSSDIYLCGNTIPGQESVLIFQDDSASYDIKIWELPVKYFLDLANDARIIIGSTINDIVIATPLSTMSTIAIGSSISATQKITLVGASPTLSIMADMKDTKILRTSAADRTLLDSSLSVSFLATTAVEDELHIGSSVQDFDIRNSVGRMADALVVTSTMGDTRAQKYLRLPGELLLGSRCVPVIDNIFRAGSSLSITSTCAVITRRARLLGEVDPFVMTEIDDMTLGDLDWVTLED